MSEVKTTEEHKKAGTYQKCRHEEKTVDFEKIADLEPPAEFSKKTKTLWKKMMPEFAKLEGIMEIDVPILVDAFSNYDAAQSCKDQLAGIDYGEYVRDLNKFKDVNLFEEYSKRMDKFNKVMMKFAVTPESRARLRIKPKEVTTDDLFSNLLGNG